MKWKWPQFQLSTLLVIIFILALYFDEKIQIRRDLAPSGEIACETNLHSLGFDLLDYRAAHGHFPTNTTNDFPHLTNPPPHSWRTRLLNYSPNFGPGLLDYDFSLPWNAPRNRPLSRKVRRNFLCENNQYRSHQFTNYVALIDHGVSSLERASTIPRNSPQAAEFILLLEYPNSDILWTEPRDLDINDLDKLTPGADPHGLGVLFADGHFERLPLPELRDRLTRLSLLDPSPTSQPAPDAP